jgi:hypothetical protein
MKIQTGLQSHSGKLKDYGLLSKLHWMRFNQTSVGGMGISLRWFRYRYFAPNGSGCLAQVAVDFQNLN